MSSITHALQICRTCGGGASVDVHFCRQCSKILTLGRQGDYFAFMGVPRRLNLDLADLEQRFRDLSRHFHPDYFYNATPAERVASLERSSYLNAAYRTLKQPVSRIVYLLELEGVLTQADRSGGDLSTQAPPALLEEVFALNEELDEVRALREAGAGADVIGPRLTQAARPIEARRVEHDAELQALAARWDGLGSDASPAARRAVLEALRARMLERHYIVNLLATIDRERALSVKTSPEMS